MILISKIYGILLSNKTSLLKYIGIAFFVELLPAVFLSALLYLFISTFDLPFKKLPDRSLSWESFWIGVVITPILETYLLILTLHILRSFKIHGLKLAIIAAVFWGMLHGVQSWPWFFPAAWGFFIFSTVYETWRLDSFKKAFTATALIHAINNFLALSASSFDI
jgi:hypothetical protein